MINELALPVHPSQRHPLTGAPITALGRRKDGRLIWPIMGGDDTAGSGGDGGSGGDAGSGDGGSSDGGDSGSGTDLGFPADTPVADMTVDQQAAYWKHHAQTHEKRAKGLSKLTGGKTAAQIKAEQDELEQYRASKRTDTEKAAKDAEDRARSEERAKFGSRLVRAEFKAALTHVPADRRDAIIEGLNLSSYLDDDGDVDTDKVKRYADTIAPADTANQQRRRDFGAGQRTEGASQRGAQGRAMAERRFGKPAATSN